VKKVERTTKGLVDNSRMTRRNDRCESSHRILITAGKEAAFIHSVTVNFSSYVVGPFELRISRKTRNGRWPLTRLGEMVKSVSPAGKIALGRRERRRRRWRKPRVWRGRNVNDRLQDDQRRSLRNCKGFKLSWIIWVGPRQNKPRNIRPQIRRSALARAILLHIDGRKRWHYHNNWKASNGHGMESKWWERKTGASEGMCNLKFLRNWDDVGFLRAAQILSLFENVRSIFARLKNLASASSSNRSFEGQRANFPLFIQFLNLFFHRNSSTIRCLFRGVR
jgi:hypothetical protein